MIFYTLFDETASAAVQHETAHRLLAKVLFDFYGIAGYSLAHGKHGKPYIENHPEIFFNLSHCRGMAVCAISDSEIGVDAELIRPYNGKAARRVFSENEIKYVSEAPDSGEAFFRLWTLKEALGKAVGTGIFSGLKEYEFVYECGVPVCHAAPEKIFTQKILYGKWAISVCTDTIEDVFVQICLFKKEM